MIIDFLIPILILFIATLIFRNSNLDLQISKIFYIPTIDEGFNRFSMPWRFFYNYGCIIPIAICIISAIFFGGSFIRKFEKPLGAYRKSCLFAILLMLFAPGLIVNLVLKNHMGRPRPLFCSEFNGHYKFVKVLDYGYPNFDNSSFPSGHAAVAFYLIFPYFLYRTYNRKKAYLYLSLGSAYGILLGITRIIQGGHFASDVIWSFGIVYLTGLILYYAFRYDV